MSIALSWSGGKDSMLALDRAVRDGLDVRWLINVYEGNTERVRFHGVRRELIAAQAEALGLELVQAHTHPADFEAAFTGILRDLVERGARGVAFGNIHLADIRAWYESRVTAQGLEHVEPLWGTPPADVVREVVARGYRPTIVSVNLEIGRAEWLGRELDADLASELLSTPGIDPAGERGEYHSFVWDGPLFREPVRFTVEGEFEREGHRVLELVGSA